MFTMRESVSTAAGGLGSTWRRVKNRARRGPGPEARAPPGAPPGGALPVRPGARRRRASETRTTWSIGQVVRGIPRAGGGAGVGSGP